jgi:DNA-binding transcriptional regulator YbjK
MLARFSSIVRSITGRAASHARPRDDRRRTALTESELRLIVAAGPTCLHAAAAREARLLAGFGP